MCVKKKDIDVCEITERVVDNVKYPTKGVDRPNEVWFDPVEGSFARGHSANRVYVEFKRKLTEKQYEKFLKFLKESGIDKQNKKYMKHLYI